MSATSRISIAMAVYNGERFLREQLDSFIRQTRLPDELVVSDNASTDRTVEIVREFVVAAPALRAAYVAVVVAGFGAWGWRAMLAPSERETVRMRLRAAMPLMSR